MHLEIELQTCFTIKFFAYYYAFTYTCQMQGTLQLKRAAYMHNTIIIITLAMQGINNSANKVAATSLKMETYKVIIIIS